MSKKILVLTGSPRRDGNSDTLAKAFKSGAEKAGAEVQIVNTSTLKISACIACDKCWEKDAPCIFKDDMEKIYPLLEWADMFVLAFPLYYYTIPTQLKVALDRFYPFEFQKTEVTKGKDASMLVCAGTDDQKEFEGLVSTYKIICNYMNWNDIGMICADSLNAKDDILNTDWLKQAEILGEKAGL